MDKQQKETKCCVAQCERPLDEQYWNTQWESRQTGWDVGYPSPSITKYLMGYTNKNASILIPGCGNAYEAEYLAENGFTNLTLIDIAPKAVELLKEKFADTKAVKILHGDFFLHQGNYDLIIEQTFFCAIPPSRRMEYAQKMASLLKKDGRLIGLLFDRTFEQGPPFGGSASEYQPIFEPYFLVKKMERCDNSIPARTGSEVFINLIKK
jgi:SAM-dependent methyltransferase